jgi:hypothetical protein
MPNCSQFEDVSGDLLRREVAAGAVAVEYPIRCFLGPESVRAANALALAAEGWPLRTAAPGNVRRPTTTGQRRAIAPTT